MDINTSYVSELRVLSHSRSVYYVKRTHTLFFHAIHAAMSSPHPSRRPTAIVVNGPSSAGKSTLCEALHRALVRRCAEGDDPDDKAFFRVAFDDFLNHVHPSALPRSFLELTGGDLEVCASREPHDGLACFEYVDETGRDDETSTTRLARLQLSEAGERFLKGQTAGWGEHLRLGTNLLVDAFLQDKAWASDLRDSLARHDARVLLVGLDCDDEELERRETARGDRFPGIARRSARVVHSHEWPSWYHIRVKSTNAGVFSKVYLDFIVRHVLRSLERLEADQPIEMLVWSPP